jgi:hypothetical protein
MPIAINGSGTITGISVGGIPDGTVDTDVLAANAVTYAKIGTTEQRQLCKAWVNFNGTGTVAIRASYNVSSITDNGTGQYTINFTNAMTDANYSVVGAVSDTSAPGGSEVFAMLRGGLSTTSCPVDSVAYTSSNVDVPFNCWSIFR